jgi:hypothetical protein
VEDGFAHDPKEVNERLGADSLRSKVYIAGGGGLDDLTKPVPQSTVHLPAEVRERSRTKFIEDSAQQHMTSTRRTAQGSTGRASDCRTKAIDAFGRRYVTHERGYRKEFSSSFANAAVASTFATVSLVSGQAGEGTANLPPVHHRTVLGGCIPSREASSVCVMTTNTRRNGRRDDSSGGIGYRTLIMTVHSSSKTRLVTALGFIGFGLLLAGCGDDTTASGATGTEATGTEATGTGATGTGATGSTGSSSATATFDEGCDLLASISEAKGCQDSATAASECKAGLADASTNCADELVAVAQCFADNQQNDCYCEQTDGRLNCEPALKQDEGSGACLDLYLAFDDCVDPKCAPGCASEYIGDQFCDNECNVEACEFDGGDCTQQ